MKERTLAILKPDCIKRKLAGEVISRLIAEGFDIIAMKMIKLTRETAGAFYAVHKERSFYDDLVKFMTEYRVVVLALEKENAVVDLRKVIGATDPAMADEGTVRKMFAESKQRNIIHASDSIENAAIEMAFFFSTKELTENNS
ncbi:MAG: nucleoside-diphosphate kinase [Calditrichaceae bacterium]|nr:nucleoside-diphosphate kinase [Calditrichaceae bacterium]MBN2707656.1 nucleoside-diphosphate kinase [Calditrichaceae bacterium]RQV93175.1 MAG: nucleoside-diphosphate kinase [Calditrichota bacterium]